MESRQSDQKVASASFIQLRRRLERIDIARAVAFVAMAVYHTHWDLEFFGYLDPGTSARGGWKIYARVIASSFLVLVGFSFVIAHGHAIQWRSFSKRLLQITIAALIITIGSWFFSPEAAIFFGILHHIALASFLGLIFLRVNIPILLLFMIGIISAPLFLRSTLFDYPSLWWVGLSSSDPRSNDYVPLFPWFGVVLGGMALARLFPRYHLMSYLAGGFRPYTLSYALQFIGRHSLAFYLLHQPILISCIFVISHVLPPKASTPSNIFTQSCEQSCSVGHSAQSCHHFCVCVISELERSGMLDSIFAEYNDPQIQRKIKTSSTYCLQHHMNGD